MRDARFLVATLRMSSCIEERSDSVEMVRIVGLWRSGEAGNTKGSAGVVELGGLGQVVALEHLMFVVPKRVDGQSRMSRRWSA